MQSTNVYETPKRIVREDKCPDAPKRPTRPVRERPPRQVQHPNFHDDDESEPRLEVNSS